MRAKFCSNRAEVCRRRQQRQRILSGAIRRRRCCRRRRGHLCRRCRRVRTRRILVEWLAGGSHWPLPPPRNCRLPTRPPQEIWKMSPPLVEVPSPRPQPAMTNCLVGSRRRQCQAAPARRHSNIVPRHAMPYKRRRFAAWPSLGAAVLNCSSTVARRRAAANGCAPLPPPLAAESIVCQRRVSRVAQRTTLPCVADSRNATFSAAAA